MNKHIFALSFFFIAISYSMIGQQLTRSPYTRYGVGDVLSASTTRNAAMGGIGVASDNYFSINRINPASYSDLVFTTMDISGFGQYSNLRNNSTSEDQITAGFQNILFGFKPSGKNFAITFGFAPYSAVGYEVSIFQPLSVNDTLRNTLIQYDGDGGINQAFAGFSTTAYDKKLRIGANLGYSFGSTRYRTETVIDSDNPSAASINLNEEIFVGGFNGQWGLMYVDTLSRQKSPGKRITMRLGLTGEHTFNLNGTQERILNNNVGETVITTDTLSRLDGAINIPDKFGIGIGLSQFGKWSVGADVTYQNWDSFSYFNDNTSLGSEIRFGIGGEYVPDVQSFKYHQRIAYRLGGYFKKSYIDFEGEAIQDYGVTLGFGIPAAAKASDRFNPGRTTSKINLSFALGKRGTITNVLPVEELYVRIRLGITINDTWFIRRVID